jgi:hypothetical protein
MPVRRPLLLIAPVLIVSVASVRTPAGAQAPPPNIIGAQWGDVGFVAGTAGFGVLLDYARLSELGLWRGRLTAHNNLGGGLNTNEPGRSVTEASVLRGRGRVCCGNHWGSASVGLGVVFGSKAGAETTRFTTVGIAAEADLISWNPPHLAARAFANANPKASFAGLALSLAVGRIPWGPYAARSPR